MILRKMFSRRWILPTLFVLVAIGVMIRLGIWQLDRLEQRMAFNARVSEHSGAPIFYLTPESVGSISPSMEFRKVNLQGEYDFTHEVVLRNQVWNDLSGVHLLTPLRISGSDYYVYVDRGWIPLDAFTAGKMERYREDGVITVVGLIRASQVSGFFGINSDPTPAPGETLTTWNLINAESLALQSPYPILPVYIQQSPDPTWKSLPYRSETKPELTEGPHQGYALQWFTFAIILGMGYPIYIHRGDQQLNQRADLINNDSSKARAPISPIDR